MSTTPANQTHVPDCEQDTLKFAAADRRAHKRFKIERQGKIYRRSTQSYLPTLSQDLSFAGALLTVRTSRPVVVGEVLEVGLALNNKAIVPESGMLRAIVVRSTPDASGEAQTVAIRYLHREAARAQAA